MNIQSVIENELQEAAKVLDDFISSSKSVNAIQQAGAFLAEAIQNEKKILSCGNGGSHCDAMHFAEEMTGRFREDRKPLPAICISDASHITCVGNDYGFEFIFSRSIQALGQAGDVLLAISTSGNSLNILRAAEAARSKGMKVIALTGKDGGKLGALADVELRVPHQGYADRIQEVHIKIIHILILLVERGLAS